jgi:hypothetical protein
MGKVPLVGRGALALALLVALWGAQGCSPFRQVAARGGAGNVVGSYVKWRFEDLFECIDLGVTVSEESGGGIYGHFASLTPFGAYHMDGTFVGLGGGQLGVTRHYMAGVGALAFGYEEVGWQDYDRHDQATVQSLGVGPIGLLAPPYGSPASAPS